MIVQASQCPLSQIGMYKSDATWVVDQLYIGLVSMDYKKGFGSTSGYVA